MGEFERRLDNLYDEAVGTLQNLINNSGEESDHISEKVLKITDDAFMFNLEGGRYLNEYSHQYGLIDNNGYQYYITAMDAENFFEVVDYLIKKYTKKEEPKEERKLDYFERQRIVNEQRAMDGDNSILGNPAY